jgi:hypothetical protein
MQDLSIMQTLMTCLSLSCKVNNSNYAITADQIVTLLGDRFPQSSHSVRQINLLEQQIIKQLKFKLHIPTPIEFICLFISILQQNVNSLETETMLLLRGEACLLSYVCWHYTTIQRHKASSIAIACMLHTMEGWAWSTVCSRFFEILKSALPEDAMVNQQEVMQVRKLIYSKLQMPEDFRNLEEKSDTDVQRFECDY